MIIDIKGTNSKNHPLENDAQLKQVFNSLPPYVQESMMQTGVEMCTVDELKKCAENLMNSK